MGGEGVDVLDWALVRGVTRGDSKSNILAILGHWSIMEVREPRQDLTQFIGVGCHFDTEHRPPFGASGLALLLLE